MSAIKVVDYNPEWPGLFEAGKSRMLGLIGDMVEDIHHVGSTSVVGLYAKLKIDIDAVLRSDAMVAEAVERVKSLANFTFHGDPYNDGVWTFTSGHGSLWHAALPLRAGERHACQTCAVSRLASHPSERRGRIRRTEARTGKRGKRRLEILH